MLDHMLRQHGLLITYRNVDVLDLLSQPPDAACDERCAVIWRHRLGNGVGQRRHAHASSGGHYYCVSNHLASSAGGLLMISSNSLSDNASAFAEQKGSLSGCATGWLNLIT